MRILMKVTITVAAGNRAIRDGMTPRDLAKAGPGIQKAVKKHGGS